MIFSMDLPGNVIDGNVEVCLGAPALSSTVTIQDPAQTMPATGSLKAVIKGLTEAVREQAALLQTHANA